MYSLIEVPSFANKDIYTFSKEDAKEYFRWFKEIKATRLQILEQSVCKDYEDWELNYTRDSLFYLYEWFIKKISYRLATESEKEEINSQISRTPLLIDVIEIPEKIFTDETVSICFDIGCYFGDTIIFNITTARWIQKTNSKKYIDYAQPLIEVDDKNVPFNPRRVIENIARLSLDNSNKLFSFLELFDELVGGG